MEHNPTEEKVLALFTSRVRVKILQLFFREQKQFYVRQVCRLINEEINAVRRELNRLVEIGLLEPRKKGNRLYYRLQRDFVFYPEIARIVAKTQGLGQTIISKAADLGSITFAMLALPFLEGRSSEKRDVDLLIVGRIRLRTLQEIIQQAEESYGKEINYSVMTLSEFEYRKKRNDTFIRQVLAQPQVMLIGQEKGFNE